MKAYVDSSARRIIHFWKPYHGSKEVFESACGLGRRESCLDTNIGNLPMCKRCEKAAQASPAATQADDICSNCGAELVVLDICDVCGHAATKSASTAATQADKPQCECKGHPFSCFGHPLNCECNISPRTQKGIVAATQPTPHSVRYDILGWICSVCGGWNRQPDDHCIYQHTARRSAKETSDALGE